MPSVSPPSQDDDSEKLARIRDILACFDWDRDECQYALEAIDRIALDE